MSEYTDVVDELQKFNGHCIETEQYEVSELVDVALALLKKYHEALEAPLPEEVKKTIFYLRGIKASGTDHAADMLERLARENKLLTSGDQAERYRYEKRYIEQQQRINSLEKHEGLLLQSVNEKKQRIEKQDQTMLAYESRIMRLDAALAEIEEQFPVTHPAGWAARKARAGK